MFRKRFYRRRDLVIERPSSPIVPDYESFGTNQSDSDSDGERACRKLAPTLIGELVLMPLLMAVTWWLGASGIILLLIGVAILASAVILILRRH